MTRDEQSARDKAALSDHDRRKIEHAKDRRRKRYWWNGQTRLRHMPSRAEARDAERARLAGVLADYRRVEWSTSGEPPHRRRHGPSPLFEPPEPVARVRPRGTYTRELVRATTRGHDHVPERPPL